LHLPPGTPLPATTFILFISYRHHRQAVFSMNRLPYWEYNAFNTITNIGTLTAHE